MSLIFCGFRVQFFCIVGNISETYVVTFIFYFSLVSVCFVWKSDLLLKFDGVGLCCSAVFLKAREVCTLFGCPSHEMLHLVLWSNLGAHGVGYAEFTSDFIVGWIRAAGLNDCHRRAD